MNTRLKTNLFFKSLLMLIVTLFGFSGVSLLASPFSDNGFADPNFSITTGTETYVPLSSYTQLYSSADDSYTTVTVPFAFRFDTTLYSANFSLTVCSNGWVGFPGYYFDDYQGGGSIAYDNLFDYYSSDIGGYIKTLHFITGDNYTRTALRYYTLGSSPNRRFVIEWVGFTPYSYSGNTSNMQLILYENGGADAGKMRMHWGTCSPYTQDNYNQCILIGDRMSRYINIQPASSGLTFWRGNSTSCYVTNSNVAYLFSNGKYIDFEMNLAASCLAVYPTDGEEFNANSVMPDSERPGIIVKRANANIPVPSVKYEIFNEDGDVVYSANDGKFIDIDLVSTTGTRYNFTSATGKLANPDGTINLFNIPGGWYTARVIFDDKKGEFKYDYDTLYSEFFVDLKAALYVRGYPLEGTILTRDIPVTPDERPAIMLTKEFPAPIAPNPTVRYKIVNYKGDVMYTALSTNGLEDVEIDLVGKNQKYYFSNATGPFAGANGNLQITSAEPGQYKIFIEFDDKVNSLKTCDTIVFSIIRTYDLLLQDITVPRGWTSEDSLEVEPYRYALGAAFPIEFQVYNGGGANINSFAINSKIYKLGSLVKEMLDTISLVNNPLQKTQIRTCSTKEVNTNDLGVGLYTVECKIIPISPAQDEDTLNNYYPRLNTFTRYFEVSEPINIAIANTMVSPGASTYRYPFFPTVSVTNLGLVDMSGSWADIEIRKNGNLVYSDRVMLQNIAYNEASDIKFTKIFMPTDVGGYNVTLTLDLHGAPKTKTFTFIVQEGLKGTNTIGAKGKYKSFNEAVDALYLQGVSGNVVFELIDDEYTLGNGDTLIPEFRSKIVGVGPDATITFKPDRLHELSATPIKIIIESDDGYGLRFGQALETGDYRIPAVNIITDVTMRREFATSEGYITFDGGSRKNINFAMVQPNTVRFSAPLYMGEGAKNITIRNCRVTGNNYTNSDLPNIQYTNESLGFISENDEFASTLDANDTLSYSTGILLRNRPYVNNLSGVADYRIDTVATNNIVIEGNIITGFGYGVVSLGMGPIYNLNKSEVELKYNHDNKFINNYINNVAKAGLFLGFEDGAIISGNRIDSVGGSRKPNEEIYGIRLGGNYRYDDCLGYHNVNLVVSENEISNIQSTLASYGIKVEQHPLAISYNSTGYRFPAEDSGIKIYNNVINRLTTTGNNANSKVGIEVTTTREEYVPIVLMVAGKKEFEGPIYNNGRVDVYSLYPFLTDYEISNVLINNNTISISEEANDESLTGIAVKEAAYYEILNNAIVIDGLDGSMNENKAILLKGLNPKKLLSNVNHNSYYVHPLGLEYNSSIIRLYEQDELGRYLEDGGYGNEYMKLTQWIGWTGEDVSSISGFDFRRDMEYNDVYLNGVKLYDVWRMKPQRQITRNSQLNNRATIINYIQKDLAGNSRINLDQNPDIGAFEFDCETYLTDIEVKMITAPRAYCDYRGKFADAEYVMVGGTAVDVKALVRNNGDVVVPNHPVRCAIYKMPDMATPVKDTTVRLTLAPGEEREVVFFSSQEESNLRFEPEPFNGEEPDQVWFTTMRTNVTPIYRIEVAADPYRLTDEFRPNDTISKNVRFYIPSNSLDRLYLLISAENTTADLSDPSLLDADIIAGRLNYDTLITAFNNMKYFIATTEQKSRHIDVIDRKGWEPRAIDYTLTRYNYDRRIYEPVYNTLFWSDGDDKELTYWEKQTLLDFANSGTPYYKKNIVIGSQEMSRENVSGRSAFNRELNDLILRSKVKGDGIVNKSFKITTDPDSYRIKGFFEGHNVLIDVLPTQYVPDEGPVPGTITKVDTVLGNVYVGYYYHTDAADADYDIDHKMSVLSSKTLTVNSIYGAIDWRHLANATAFLAGIFDDIGGDLIVPVELVSFNANSLGKRVMLDWSTASEINTNTFEVERADVSANGVYGLFNSINTQKAAGTSNTLLNYNYTDRSVDYGNTYAYRLKVTDADGSYSYSALREVTISNANGLNLNEFVPNPANIVSNLSYTLGNAVNNLRISILDITGKEVSVLYEGSKPSGEYVLDLDVANLSSGVYTVIFNVDGSVAAKTLNVVK
ncbi:MAG: T9SS type A sorting domain-containing protein [Bacteroidetes bacterium]|nr:T9SS type A sorting domain-containing protein [Bacteroidota bacterium]